MATPKQHDSYSKARRRRSHQALEKKQLIVCPECKHPTEQHRACSYCGYYKGKSIRKV